MEDETSESSVPGRHQPTIREWELTSNSTVYDHMLAAPSDDDLMKMWIGYAVVTGLCSIVTIVVFLGVISSRKARKNPFNLYLLFLLVPDIVVSSFCCFTCTLNIINGQYTSEGMCLFQSFYIMFSVSSNAWLNAAVARQLYLMLSSARSFKRYRPPSKKKIAIESTCVYAFGLFLGSWGLWDQAWWPYRIQSLNGMACFPVQYDLTSTMFFYFVFVPCFIGIPLVYVLWATYQIFRNKMLPPSGRRRMLAIYFLRLGIAFIVMWLPFFVLTFILGQWMSAWVSYSGAMWGHLQATVSAAVSLLKPDIYKAVKEFLCCRTCSSCRTNSTMDNHTVGSRSEDDNITVITNPSSSATARRWSMSSYVSTSSRSHDHFPIDNSDLELVREWDKKNSFSASFFVRGWRKLTGGHHSCEEEAHENCHESGNEPNQNTNRINGIADGFTIDVVASSPPLNTTWGDSEEEEVSEWCEDVIEQEENIVQEHEEEAGEEISSHEEYGDDEDSDVPTTRWSTNALIFSPLMQPKRLSTV